MHLGSTVQVCETDISSRRSITNGLCSNCVAPPKGRWKHSKLCTSEKTHYCPTYRNESHSWLPPYHIHSCHGNRDRSTPCLDMAANKGPTSDHPNANALVPKPDPQMAME